VCLCIPDLLHTTLAISINMTSTGTFPETSTSTYPNILLGESVFKTECSTIAENIRRCAQQMKATSSTKSSHTFEFTEKRQLLLMLNMHCEKEMNRLTTELQRDGIDFRYKLIYNTKLPYRVSLDTSARSVYVSQHPFM
jgi:hypothetical protein